MNAQQFNEAFQVGQVVYYLEDGPEDSKIKTVRQRLRIRGKAWDMNDGRTVVMFIGRAGSFDVSKVTRRQIENSQYEQAAIK